MADDNPRLVELLIAEVERRGFVRCQEEAHHHVTVWTHPDWHNYYRDHADPPNYEDREEFLLDVVAHIIGHESGFDAIKSQPAPGGPRSVVE